MVIEWRQQPNMVLQNQVEPSTPTHSVNEQERVELVKEQCVIPRLSREEMKNLKLSELSSVAMLHYQGPKKPIPPAFALKESYQDMRACNTLDTKVNAIKADVAWLSKLIDDDIKGEPIAEWSGYMSAEARASDTCLPQPATKYVFGPLIDATPAHLDTVLTTMHLAEEFAKQHSQVYTYMEADMQIFKLGVHIKWSDQERWKHMILRHGGMHTLMSFVGCIGVLMAGTGLEAILNAAFKGVPNM